MKILPLFYWFDIERGNMAEIIFRLEDKPSAGLYEKNLMGR